MKILIDYLEWKSILSLCGRAEPYFIHAAIVRCDLMIVTFKRRKRSDDFQYVLWIVAVFRESGVRSSKLQMILI